MKRTLNGERRLLSLSLSESHACMFSWFILFIHVDLQMGLKYDCAVEDIITGFSIQCRGWKSIYCRPERNGFLGVAPTTLLQSLIQHKRWSEGQLQIFLSKHNPFVYGHRKIPLSLQFSYSRYSMWALNCLATLYYLTVPTLCLLGSISLFPEVCILHP